MINIYKNLYQYSTYIPQINITFHQYLLQAEESILIHTGNVVQAQGLIPKLKELLGKNPLGYIFVSHFEADECGGLEVVLNSFPEAIVICSEVTARQFDGFGFDIKAEIKKPEEKIILGSCELEFLSYPSEIHLWEGLLALERRLGIFFSSDLFFQTGNTEGIIKESDWHTEINKITTEQIPSPELLKELQKRLYGITPEFIASGHGACIRLV